MKARRIEKENFYFLFVGCFHYMGYYYVNDLFTPQKMIDTSGNTVWQADWDSFGTLTVTINTIENNLRFPGQYYDSETGFYYNFHRYYMPEIGRYLREDEVKDKWDFNLYVYVGDRPISLIDSYGLIEIKNCCSVVVRCRGVEKLGIFSFLAFHCYIVVNNKHHSNYPKTLTAGPEEVNGRRILRAWVIHGDPVDGNSKSDHVYYKNDNIDCKVVECLENKTYEFNSFQFYYHLFGPNCNYFVHWVTQQCGINVSPPWRAYGWDIGYPKVLSIFEFN